MTIEFGLRQATDQTPSADHTDGKLDECATPERDEERTSAGSSLLPRQSGTVTASGVNSEGHTCSRLEGPSSLEVLFNEP